MHMHAYGVGHKPIAGMSYSMTERSAKSPRVRASLPRSRAGDLRDAATDATIARYAGRGRECAFANTRLLGRVVTNFYDAALKPADLRASQLALLWAILACEPVELGRLVDLTDTDQSTLSRTVDKLRQAGLVSAEAATDRRVRLLKLTDEGRRRFARAMPCWEAAQREIDSWLSISGLRELAKRAHRLAREGPQ